jgi:hypothetical protein
MNLSLGTSLKLILIKFQFTQVHLSLVVSNLGVFQTNNRVLVDFNPKVWF